MSTSFRVIAHQMLIFRLAWNEGWSIRDTEITIRQQRRKCFVLQFIFQGVLKVLTLQTMYKNDICYEYPICHIYVGPDLIVINVFRFFVNQIFR